MKKIKKDVENDNKKLIISSFNINIEEKLNTKAQSLWFSLLFNAFTELKHQNKFLIPAGQLKQEIKYASKNNQGLKKLLAELKSVIIEWKIADKYGETWELNSLLADCRIKTGTDAIEYSFSSFLQEKLTEPDIFTKLNLLLTRRFKSKNSLAIYCLSIDNLYSRSNFGIKNFTLQEFRHHLGLEEYEYFKPGELLKHVIKKSEEDININSDLNVKIIPIRTDIGKITGFQLEVSIKPDFVKFYRQPKIAEIENLQNKPEINKKKVKVEPVSITDKGLKQFLSTQNINLNNFTILERLSLISGSLGKENLEEYLLFLMSYTEQEHKKGNAKKIPGFFINLIKDDLQLQNYILNREKHKKASQDKAAKITELVDKKLREKYDSFISEDFREYFTNNADRLEAKLIEVIKTTLPSDHFIREIIAKIHKGTIDKTLITNSKSQVKYPVLSHLKNYSGEFGYNTISFESWKAKTVTDKLLEEIKEEVTKEL